MLRFPRPFYLCLWGMLLALLLSGCRGSAPSSVPQPSPVTVGGDPYLVALEKEDWDDSYSSLATQVTFSEDKIQVDGRGASVQGNRLTITSGGEYHLSGEMTNGTILVLAPETQIVQLVFDHLSLRCANDAPLYIISAQKVLLTLAPGSVNTLSDGSSYAFYHGENKVDGCIYSKVDLTINGTGTLHVLGNFRHGIVSKDGLSVAGGIVQVTANGQGLAGKDFVKIGGGELILMTQKDGIQSNNAAPGQGFVSLLGGKVSIDAQTDAIQAESLLYVAGGEYSLITKGGWKNAPSSLYGSPHEKRAIWGETKSSEEEEDPFNAKGLKAKKSIQIHGGHLTFDTFDDAIHSNGDVGIGGGDIDIATGDDGIHGDGNIVISGGNILIPQCYEGIEGRTVTLSGGKVEVAALDDGINAASSDPLVESVPKTSLSQPDNPIFVRLSGGNHRIDGAGDGIDSNGDLYVEGGSTLVFGASYSSDAALDYDGTAIITGGEFLAAGSAPWAQGFGDASTQPSLFLSLPDTVAQEIPLYFEDASGKVMASAIPPRMYQSLVYSSPQLLLGEKYTFRAGELRATHLLDQMNATNVTVQGLQPPKKSN